MTERRRSAPPAFAIPRVLAAALAAGLLAAPAGAEAAADAPPQTPAAAAPSPAPAPAEDPNADPLEKFLWTARPIVIFADNDRDPRLAHQLREIARVQADLDARDAVVIVDTDPGPSRFETTALRRRFRPHDFNLILIGKDGQVKRRSPQPVSGAQLVRQIDRLPIRLQEMGRP